MIVSDVTLLPQPDSPTMPSVWLRSTVNETPSTARTIPSSVLEAGAKIANLEQCHQLRRILGSNQAYTMSTIRLKMMMQIVANTVMPRITGRSKFS